MGPKVWFITGTSRGMGTFFARTALNMGHYVVATGRKPEAVRRAIGEHPNLEVARLDVCDTAQIQEAVKAAIARFGHIDILVNNAGYGIFGALEETTDEETRAIFDTNLFGPMNVTRAVVPHMREQHSGRIVNISSMAGYSTDPGGALYDTTKFALVGLTEVLASELAPFGIECMVVCPGMIRTDFFDDASIKAPAHPLPVYDDTPARGALDYCLSHNHQQYGDPQKVADLVCATALSEKMPLWLPVGKDAMKKLQKKCERMLEETAPYYERSAATAFPRKML